jgi:hypothetical protein
MLSLILAQAAVATPAASYVPVGAWIAAGALILAIVTALLRQGREAGRVDSTLVNHGERISGIETSLTSKLDGISTQIEGVRKDTAMQIAKVFEAVEVVRVDNAKQGELLARVDERSKAVISKVRQSGRSRSTDK